VEATKRIYRTDDGRLVLHGDPDAAFLAYAPTDDVEPPDIKKVKALLEPPEEPKAAPKAADKAVRATANK